MQFMKTCGCIVDYREIPGNEDKTASPMEEVVVTYCEGHDPNNLDEFIKIINNSSASVNL